MVSRPPRRPAGPSSGCMPGAPRRARRPPAVALPGRDPAPGRRLGRALLHGHRLSGRLLPQLPPLSRRLPGHGARPGARGRAVSDALLILVPLRIERARARPPPARPCSDRDGAAAAPDRGGSGPRPPGARRRHRRPLRRGRPGAPPGRRPLCDRAPRRGGRPRRGTGQRPPAGGPPGARAPGPRRRARLERSRILPPSERARPRGAHSRSTWSRPGSRPASAAGRSPSARVVADPPGAGWSTRGWHPRACVPCAACTAGAALAAWGRARAGEVELAPAVPSARTADADALRSDRPTS